MSYWEMRCVIETCQVALVSHPQVSAVVPRSGDALILDPVQPLVIFSNIVHVYVLLGDEVCD